MNISEMFKTKKTVFSFEVFPPKQDTPIESIYSTIDELAQLNPDFISVTYGAGAGGVSGNTVKLASHIKNKCGIEPVAHLTCVNSTKAQIDQVLESLGENNIENVMALRGDITENAVFEFNHATDLINHIKQNYSYNVLGACHPETHPESINAQTDIEYLKMKEAAGASHFITQLFFDNNDFYNFMYRLRTAGIKVPVQAGIMPVINKKSIKRIVSLCQVSFPKKFVKILDRFGDDSEALFEAGIAYATDQIIDLATNSVEGIHLYTMNNPRVAKEIIANTGNIIASVNR